MKTDENWPGMALSWNQVQRGHKHMPARKQDDKRLYNDYESGDEFLHSLPSQDKLCRYLVFS